MSIKEIDPDTMVLIEPSSFSHNNRFPTIEVQGGVVDVYASLRIDPVDTTEMSLEIASFGSAGNAMRFLSADALRLYCTTVSGTPRLWVTFGKGI